MSERTMNYDSIRFWLDVDLVSDLREVLDALDSCHASVALFESLTTDLPSRWVVADAWWMYSSSIDPRARWIQEARIALLPDERLQVLELNLSSPGWLEVVGAWNPLAFIRDFLSDREERRRNREYRDRIEEEKGEAEVERLRLENERLRTDVFRDRVATLVDLGMPMSEAIRMVNVGLQEPLEEFGTLADRGLVRLGPPRQTPERNA